MIEDFYYTITNSDLDLYGHVNHARYLEIYELARWHHCEGFKLSKEDVVLNQKGLVVIEVKVKYKKEVHLNETLQIKTHFHEFLRPIDHIDQVMINSVGLVASTAIITCAYFDLNLRKLIPVPDFYKDEHAKVMKAQGPALNV